MDKNSMTLGAIVRAAMGEIDKDASAARERCATGPHGGLIVPGGIFGRKDYEPTTGAALIPENLNGDLFIEPLAAKTVLAAAGAQFVEIEKPGFVKIPKSTAVETHWVTETAEAPAAAEPEFSAITAKPHTLEASVDVSHLLALQNPLLEAELSRLILAAMAAEIDRKALAGDGTNGSPVGLLATTGVSSVAIETAGSATAAEIASFVDTVTDADADDEKVAFVAPSKVRKALRDIRRPIIEGTSVGGELILGPDGRLFGKPLHVSNVAPAKKLVAGDFSQMIVATWGNGLELMFDRYSHSKTGATRVVAFLDADVIVRNSAAFAVGTVLA